MLFSPENKSDLSVSRRLHQLNFRVESSERLESSCLTQSGQGGVDTLCCHRAVADRKKIVTSFFEETELSSRVDLEAKAITVSPLER